jgi:hypothetical protein
LTDWAWPAWATPFIHFWAANVSSIALLGVVVLAVLYAFKSWQAGQRKRTFSAARVWWIAAAATAIGSVPLYQTSVAPWTVRLLDDQGAPVARVPVAQHLIDESVEISDLEPQVTDSSGAVQFPARRQWTSLARVALRALAGGHRVKADIWIPRNPIAEPLVPHQGVSAACEDRACREGPLESALRVRRLFPGATR